MFVLVRLDAVAGAGS